MWCFFIMVKSLAFPSPSWRCHRDNGVLDLIGYDPLYDWDTYTCRKCHYVYHIARPTLFDNLTDEQIDAYEGYYPTIKLKEYTTTKD